jgi:hypothetical protein
MNHHVWLKIPFFAPISLFVFLFLLLIKQKDVPGIYP